MNRLRPPAATLRRGHPRGVEFAEVAFILVLLTGAIVWSWTALKSHLAAHPAARPAVARAAATAPVPAHAAGVNLPVVLAIVAAVLALPFLAWGGVRLAGAVGARRRARALRAEVWLSRQELFGQLRDRHEKVQDAWSAYREDIGALLAAPALGDVSVPQTAALVDAAGRAQDLRPGSCPEAPELLAQYEDAVRALERAWRVAADHARRVGTGLLSPAERKRVSQAMSLLAIARDGGASANERRLAYQRVTALLEGILAVPAEAFGLLESSLRQALPAA